MPSSPYRPRGSAGFPSLSVADPDPRVAALRAGVPPRGELRSYSPLPSELVARWAGDQLARFVDRREATRLGHKIGTAATTLVPVDAPGNILAASSARGEAVRRGDIGAQLEAEASGVFNLLAMAGVVGSAAKGGKLAMDKASRMSRAKDLGFDVDQTLYHGTSRNFPRFDVVRKGGQTTGSATARVGVWLTPEPEHAALYADEARKAHGGAPRVLALHHRPGKAAELRLQGSESDRQVAATLAEAFETEGYDSVRVIPHTGGKGEVVVSNPNQLRSIHAAFDPKKRKSSDLLASFGVGASAGLAGSLLDDRRRPHPLFPEEKQR